MSKIKTIGILTSGGDAPGMNAVIRSVVRTAHFGGLNVKGIRQGYAGLLEKNAIDMDLRSVSGSLHYGGTILGSARSKEFAQYAGVEQARDNCIALGLDGLIVAGGDGSFRGARDLSAKGIPCIGIPCTIDNNIGCTDYTIGFDTAVNTLVEIVDKLRDTSQSHSRCSVVEVMGHNSGNIALYTGICCGAEAILIPEVPSDIERDVLGKMRKAQSQGKTHFIIIVSEGVTGERAKQRSMDTQQLADFIEARTGVETRATVIGHIQRGGSPNAHDRKVGSLMGNYAVKLLSAGAGSRVVAMRGDKIVDYDIADALNMSAAIDLKQLQALNEIS